MTHYKNWVVFLLFWTCSDYSIDFFEEFIVPYKHAVIFFKLWPPLARSSLDTGKNSSPTQSPTHSQSFIHIFTVSYVFILLSLLFFFFLPLAKSWSFKPCTSHLFLHWVEMIRENDSLPSKCFSFSFHLPFFQEYLTSSHHYSSGLLSYSVSHTKHSVNPPCRNCMEV